MTYTLYWRKAITVSVCLHMVLLVAAGYLTAGLTAPVQQETLLELDLMNNPVEQPGSTLEQPLPAKVPLPVPAEPTLVKQEQSEATTEPRVTSGDLSVTEAEIPPALATSQSSVSTGTQTGGTKAAPSGSSASTRGAIAAPGILTKVDPVYPQAARQAGLEGTVVLKIQILPNGRPGEITISRSTGHSTLDNAGITAVRQWRFIPAKDMASGQAVACTITLPLSFRLQDAQ